MIQNLNTLNWHLPGGSVITEYERQLLEDEKARKALGEARTAMLKRASEASEEEPVWS